MTMKVRISMLPGCEESITVPNTSFGGRLCALLYFKQHMVPDRNDPLNHQQGMDRAPKAPHHRSRTSTLRNRQGRTSPSFDRSFWMARESASRLQFAVQRHLTKPPAVLS